MKSQTILRRQTEMNEISISYSRPNFDSMPAINSSVDAYNVIKIIYQGVGIDYQEYFWCIYLTNANRVLGYCEIGKGDQTGTIVNVPQIFAIALKVSAKAIILVHNHPSGKLKASKQDKRLVKRIEDIGKLFLISVLDSVIVTSESYLSFADEGMMNFARKNQIPF